MNTDWEKLQTVIDNNRLAQAMLFLGPLSAPIEKLINQLIATRLCTAKTVRPCLQCSDCLMFEQKTHPDLLIIQPEKVDSAIKIEQIRTLQSDIYQKPQRGMERFLLIKPAENMNKAAANALLKILEEPPAHARFILIAAQLITLPRTIVSRCQLWTVNPDNIAMNPLALSETAEVDIQKQRDLMLDDLMSLLNNKRSPSTIAANWKPIPPKTLVWLLYLIYAQMAMINTGASLELKGYNTIEQLASLVTCEKIFYQLDKINTLQKKLSHNIHVNVVLAVEDLLMDLCQGEHYV